MNTSKKIIEIITWINCDAFLKINDTIDRSMKVIMISISVGRYFGSFVIDVLNDSANVLNTFSFNVNVMLMINVRYVIISSKGRTIVGDVGCIKMKSMIIVPSQIRLSV